MTRFPNGLETTNFKASGNVDVGGKINAPSVESEVAKAIDIGMVNADYTLNTEEKKATYINVATSTHAKDLILGKAAGSIVVVKVTAATNTITVKQAAGNTGIAVATSKHAIIMSTGTDVLLLAAIQ